MLLIWSAAGRASGVAIIRVSNGSTIYVTNLAGSEMTTSEWSFTNEKLISSQNFIEAVGLKLNYA